MRGREWVQASPLLQAKQYLPVDALGEDHYVDQSPVRVLVTCNYGDS